MKKYIEHLLTLLGIGVSIKVVWKIISEANKCKETKVISNLYERYGLGSYALINGATAGKTKF